MRPYVTIPASRGVQPDGRTGQRADRRESRVDWRCLSPPPKNICVRRGPRTSFSCCGVGAFLGLVQFPGSSSCRRREGWSLIRRSTWVNQARGSTTFSLAVMMREYIAAARSPPRSLPANCHAYRPRAAPRSARSAALLVRQMRPSLWNRLNALQCLSIQPMALATSAFRRNFASRIIASTSGSARPRAIGWTGAGGWLVAS